MGTFSDSKIATAKRDYPCEQSRMPEPHSIKRGDRYLRYKLGLKWDVHVCLPCALKMAPAKYDCAAIRAEAEQRASYTA